MNESLRILERYAPAFIEGASVTLLIASAVWLIGLVGGFLIGYSAAKRPLMGTALAVIAFVIAAIPAIALLYWFHYPFQVIIRANIEPIYTTIAVLGAINVAVVAEIVRDATKKVGKEFLEVAFINGLQYRKALLKVEIPLVLRASAGRLISAQVLVIHMTLFASLISVNELFRVAQRVNSIEYDPVSIYTAMALIYFCLSAPLILASVIASRRFGRDLSER